jgi:hypothetical protein
MAAPPIIPAISAALIARGAGRALEQLGFACLREFPLANSRRADILALGHAGQFAIIEIKSSIADFRADNKWRYYREFSDRFYFAVAAGFPTSLIPEDCGLLVADAFDAALVRDGTATPLSAARRRALTVRFGRIAALRLQRCLDGAGTRSGGI